MRILCRLAILCCLFIIVSCHNERDIVPTKGNVTFSLSKKMRSNGRAKEAANPAYLLLNITSSNGKAQQNLKLSLFALGQGFVSENLELQTGIYQLTQFAVLDDSNKIIYATPLEGSALAKYVVDPLPIEFIIADGQMTQVVPQVLATLSSDVPEIFGMASFGFDIIEIPNNLSLSLAYPDLELYDSAYIIFKNASSEIKQKLDLDNSTHLAKASVTNMAGDWKISISFFNNLIEYYESYEKNEMVDIKITQTTTALISDESGIYTEDGTFSIKKPMEKVEYYNYQLYSSENKLEGIGRLPADPLNPFVEVRTFNPKWAYMYTDRAFYNSSLDGSSNFYQGGAAFEIYGNIDNDYLIDSDIIDEESLKPGIDGVKSKMWNNADCFILLDDKDGNEIRLYHKWDLRESQGGRIRPSISASDWNKSMILKRTEFMLNH